MPKAEGPQLILASASARRADLLASAGLAFVVDPAALEEVQRAEETPEGFARRTAREKALAVLQRCAPAARVLAADTVVVIDGLTLGKPRDRVDARRMIDLLSDRDHEVITAFCLLAGGHRIERAVSTRVCFRHIGEQERESYLDRAEWHDKAGAYAIQAEAGGFVRAIYGSYSNVVGLPLCETLQALQELESESDHDRD